MIRMVIGKPSTSRKAIGLAGAVTRVTDAAREFTYFKDSAGEIE
jgi:hypothetical protein